MLDLLTHTGMADICDPQTLRNYKKEKVFAKTMDMDEVTLALLEASRRLSVSKTSSSENNNAYQNNPNSKNSSATTVGACTITTTPVNLLQATSNSLESSSASSPNTSLLSDSSPSSYSSSSLLHTLFGGIQGMGRSRSVSESHATSGAKVKVDLTPWLTDSQNVKELKVARERVRKNSVKEVEEAMSGGLSSADMYMPPI